MIRYSNRVRRFVVCLENVAPDQARRRFIIGERSGTKEHEKFHFVFTDTC